MAESRVFVAILSRSSLPSPWIAMELGAALAWGKSIDLFVEGITESEVPASLAQYRVVPLARLTQILDEIVQSIEPLSDDQIAVLGETYLAVGVPTDQLAARPASLDLLTQRFNRREGTNYSPERILQEVVRLRKQGRLPKLKRKTG